MLAIVEKLKSLMNGYTEKIKAIYTTNQKNTSIYSSDYISKKIAEEVTAIRNSTIPPAKNLIIELTVARDAARKKLFDTKYPNVTNEATRTAGELQLAHARDILKDPEFENILIELEEATNLGRVDFASSILDTIKSKKLFPEDSRLNDLEKAFNDKYNITKPILELEELNQNLKLSEVFLNELFAGGEYTPYPIKPSELTDEQYFQNHDLVSKSSTYWQKMTA